MPDGGHAESGHVLCWNPSLSPALDDFTAALKAGAAGLVRSAPIERDGSFEIRPAAGDASVVLVALSPGAISSEPSLRASSGAVDVLIPMRFLYGLRIEVEDAGGGPPRASPLLFEMGPRASTSAGDFLTPVPRFLQALGPPSLRQRRTRDQWLCVATSDQRLAGLGPVLYANKIPGYEALQVELLLPPIADSVDVIDLRVRAEATSWCDLRLRCLVAPPILEWAMVAPEDQVFGMVLLSSSGGRSLNLGLRPSGLMEDLELRGVPAGPYDLHFEAADGYFQTPPYPILLEPGENTVHLDLSGVGGFLLSLRAGPPGWMRMMLLDDTQSAIDVYFDRPPYGLGFLAPGTYRLESLASEAGSIGLGNARKFEVRSGEIRRFILEADGELVVTN